MNTSLSGLFSVSGASQEVARYLSDGRIGRVDFQVRNTSNKTLILNVVDEQIDGSGSASVLSSAVSVLPGGIVTLSAASAKPVIKVISASSNTASGQVHITGNFLGTTFYGNLQLLPSSALTAFNGPNIL